jgi:hypothetical protein
MSEEQFKDYWLRLIRGVAAKHDIALPDDLDVRRMTRAEVFAEPCERAEGAMKRFRVVIDGLIEADDIDEALRALATHFTDTRLYGMGAEPQFLPGSTVKIEPVEDDKA